MHVEVPTDWVGCRSTELTVGDLFSAKIDDADSLAMIAADPLNSRYVLVLTRSSPEALPPGASLPITRGLNALPDRVLKFQGKATARPLQRAIGPTGVSFPLTAPRVRHGFLIIDKESTPWLKMLETGPFHAEHALKFSTGEWGNPELGSIHAEWELVAHAGTEDPTILARYQAD